MKISITKDRVVDAKVFHHEEWEAPNCPFEYDRPFIVTTVTIKVPLTVGTSQSFANFRGDSYCSPQDNFIRRKGRGKAITRAFRQDDLQILSKSDRKIIADVVVLGMKSCLSE